MMKIMIIVIPLIMTVGNDDTNIHNYYQGDHHVRIRPGK